MSLVASSIELAVGEISRQIARFREAAGNLDVPIFTRGNVDSLHYLENVKGEPPTRAVLPTGANRASQVGDAESAAVDRVAVRQRYLGPGRFACSSQSDRSTEGIRIGHTQRAGLTVDLDPW